MRINLGSGQRPFKGFVNVDAQARWNPDVVADGQEYLATLEDNLVDLIVLHHIREHADCTDGAALIAACHRVIKPGGSLLVFVPDMRMLAQGWLEGKISDQIYMTNVYGAYQGDEADRHKWGLTAKMLEKELLDAKFFPVLPFDWRKIEGADIAGPAWWLMGQEGIKR